MHRPAPRSLRALLATGVAAVLTASTLALGAGAPATADGARAQAAPATPAATAATSARRDTTGNPVTPGDFTGFGFDQCLTPTQKSMNTWLNHSPFLAVGIYISGDSRACRDQPNLTPAWVRKQLKKGWRLLPITLGPQASCQPRFPRYDDDRKISPKPGKKGKYGLARTMARKEATKAVAAAQALGIVPGSTLWYDLEGYDNSNRHCRESALAFLSAWTTRLHQLDYVSGVYSSSGSGIRALDDARVERPNAFTLPDMVWIARWDGRANTSAEGIREDGWRPGGRVKQYQGGHDETWGGVTINIDRNYLEVGRGSVAEPEQYCGGTVLAFASYPTLAPAPKGSKTKPVNRVKALQCLLQQEGHFTGKVNGAYNPRTIAAANAWREARGWKPSDTWGTRDWVALLAAGPRQVLKVGSAGSEVRRVQRALNAARAKSLPAYGVYDARTRAAVVAYQQRIGVEPTGIVSTPTWRALSKGRS